MSRKAAIVSLIVIACTAASAFAADEPEFFPMLPQIMGEGGDVTASAHGYISLFTNPAGFSRAPGDFTFGATTWLYARPDRALETLLGMAGDPADATLIPKFVSTEVPDGGFGVGGLFGVGWAGSGLGLGAFMLMDSFIDGPNMGGAEGDFTATLGFVGGLSVPVKLGDITLHVGGDVRPMVRIHGQLTYDQVKEMIEAMSDGGDVLSPLLDSNTLYGVGVGFDLGAIMEIGGLSAGLSIRDLLGTTFSYSEAPFGTVIYSLSQTQNLPEGTAPSDTYTIPMNVSAGVAYNPDLGALKFFVDPTVHAGLSDVIGVIQEGRSPWTLLHVGAEAKILSVFTLQAGLNQGYLTAGAGLHLLFLDLNFAIFTRELGLHLKDQPSSGASLDVAIRF
jgi:hypothetical protein